MSSSEQPDELQPLIKEAERLFQVGQEEAALRLCAQITDSADRQYGPDSASTSHWLHGVASLYHRRGRCRDAELLYRRSLSIDEATLGADHPVIAITLNNLAKLYADGSDPIRAEPLFKRSLAITEKASGPRHPGLVRTLNNLAALQRDLGRYSEAESLFKHALSILDNADDPSEEDASQLPNSLAVLYLNQSCFAEAEVLLKRSLAIRTASNALNNLAELYRRQGRYPEAEQLYLRAISTREREVGPDHPDVGTMLNNLGSVCGSMGQFDRAEGLYKRSLAIAESALGPNHPHVATTLNNLAGLYRDEGRYVDAEVLFKRDLAICEVTVGPAHPDTATTLNNLGGLYRRQHRFGEAETAYARALALREAAFGPHHPETAVSLNTIGVLRFEEGRYAEAQALYERALAIRELALGHNHPDVATTLNNLAVVYQRQQRYEDADAVYRRLHSLPGWGVVDIPILFATNRGHYTRGSLPTSFDAEQRIAVKDITFGSVVARAPSGELLNRASRMAAAFGQLDRALGRQTTESSIGLSPPILKNSRQFSDAIGERVTRAARFHNQALIYVHGYNCGFQEAARRAAMIAFDLVYDGPTFLFSWPARQGTFGYGGDRERARIAAPFLVGMLELIFNDFPKLKINLVAHSTGAEVLLNALDKVVDRSENRGQNLSELVFAHADVNRHRFRQVIDTAITRLRVGVTSYSSAEDWPMRISRLLRFEAPRIGGAPVHQSGVDSIDISGLGSVFSLNHNVFVRNPLVFGDISRLLASGDRPPDKRSPQFGRMSTPYGTHWVYKRAM